MDDKGKSETARSGIATCEGVSRGGYKVGGVLFQSSSFVSLGLNGRRWGQRPRVRCWFKEKDEAYTRAWGKGLTAAPTLYASVTLTAALGMWLDLKFGLIKGVTSYPKNYAAASAAIATPFPKLHSHERYFKTKSTSHRVR
jgi:hypothetical protein